MNSEKSRHESFAHTFGSHGWASVQGRGGSDHPTVLRSIWQRLMAASIVRRMRACDAHERRLIFVIARLRGRAIQRAAQKLTMARRPACPATPAYCSNRARRRGWGWDQPGCMAHFWTGAGAYSCSSASARPSSDYL